MAIKTTQEQLEEVQTAISAIMNGGQEVATRGGKRLTLADLDALTRREAMLLSRYRQETGSGLTSVTGIIKRD